MSLLFNHPGGSYPVENCPVGKCPNKYHQIISKHKLLLRGPGFIYIFNVNVDVIVFCLFFLIAK